MISHCRWLNGTESDIDWGYLSVSQIEHLPLVYEVSFPTTIQSCQCPFPGCPGTSWIWSGMRNYFSRLHCEDNILILEEHPSTFPYCERCKLQGPPWLLNNSHYNTKSCHLGQERQRRWETLQRCFKSNQVAIKVNLNPLEATTAFLYLGHTIVYNNSDWASLYSNLRGSHRRWGMVEEVMGKTA